MTARCVNARCRKEGEPRDTAGNRTLCWGCEERLARLLGEIGFRYDMLGHFLATGGTGGEPVSGSKGNGLPYRVGVAGLRWDIKAHLVGWVKLLIEERNLTSWPADNAIDLAAFLRRHIDWWASHDLAGELISDMAIGVSRATGMADLPRDRVRVKVGPCPERVVDDPMEPSRPCGGTCWAHFPQKRDEHPWIDCDRCTAVWNSFQWRRLGRRIEKARAS